jgi:hypothetical protein
VTAALKRSDAALMNSVRAKGIRKRTTHIPGASPRASLTAARIRRFSSVRVTARFA